MDIKAYIQSGIIESFVLGLTTTEEAAEVSMLSTQHPEIKMAIDDFSLSLEKNALDNAVTPAPEIKSKLLTALEDEFENEKLASVPFNDHQTYFQSTVKLWQFAAAAAILLFVVSAGLNIYIYNNYKSAYNNYQALLIEKNSLQANNDIYQTKMNELTKSLQMMGDTVMKVVAMKSVKHTNDLATIYWNTKTKDVYLLQNSLPQTISTKQYQLWAIVNGKPVDAGVIDACTGLCKMKNIPNAQAFAITLENKGGSPTPTLSAMYVMGGV